MKKIYLYSCTLLSILSSSFAADMEENTWNEHHNSASIIQAQDREFSLSLYIDALVKDPAYQSLVSDLSEICWVIENDIGQNSSLGEFQNPRIEKRIQDNKIKLSNLMKDMESLYDSYCAQCYEANLEPQHLFQENEDLRARINVLYGFAQQSISEDSIEEVLEIETSKINLDFGSLKVAKNISELWYYLQRDWLFEGYAKPFNVFFNQQLKENDFYSHSLNEVGITETFLRGLTFYVPGDVWRNIFQYLEFSDFYHFARASKPFYTLITENSIPVSWKKHLWNAMNKVQEFYHKGQAFDCSFSIEELEELAFSASILDRMSNLFLVKSDVLQLDIESVRSIHSFCLNNSPAHFIKYYFTSTRWDRHMRQTAMQHIDNSLQQLIDNSLQQLIERVELQSLSMPSLSLSLNYSEYLIPIETDDTSINIEDIIDMNLERVDQ